MNGPINISTSLNWDRSYHPLLINTKPMTGKLRTQSSVWLHAYEKDGRVYFEADSDSTFVKGEIALLIMVLSGQKPEDVVKSELTFLDTIGLRQHIAVTRANGLASMIKQMKLYALGLTGVK